MPILRIGRRDNIGGKLSSASTDAEIRASQKVRKDYGYWLDRYPNHPVVLERDVLRWKKNEVIDWIIDRVDLNVLWVDFYNKKMPIEDMATVYRMMGYSLCGFEEVFGEHFQEG